MRASGVLLASGLILMLGAVIADAAAADRIAFSSNRDGSDQIYAMNADGSGQTRLTHTNAAEEGPEWSPDGTKLVFQSNRDGNYEVYVMNADGSNPTRFTSDPANDLDPDWSSDGKQISFERCATVDPNTCEVFVMNADRSGTPAQLTHNVFFDGLARWSPDGHQLAFESDREGGGVIGTHVMNADGSGQALRVSPGGEPDWSPDGTNIAYYAPDLTANDDVYTINAAGQKNRLTTAPGFDGDIGWSPDGARIAFQSGRDGNPEIYVMKADGSGQTRLTATTAIEAHPRFQPPPPQLGKTVAAQPLSGKVLVSLPHGAARARASARVPGLKGRIFVPLEAVRSLPVGSFVDTRRGKMNLLTASTTAGKTQAADISGGVFRVLQSRKRNEHGLTELKLAGGSFKGCTVKARAKRATTARRRKKKIRKLRVNVHGHFRTGGHYAAGTSRGTDWTLTDRCDGTLTAVHRGTVAVRDFRRRKTILVRKGKSYLARATRAR